MRAVDIFGNESLPYPLDDSGRLATALKSLRRKPLDHDGSYAALHDKDFELLQGWKRVSAIKATERQHRPAQA